MSLAPTRRVDRGRGHSYLMDGEPADGVTWVIDHGLAKPALIGWAANATAGYAVDHWSELAELPISRRLDVLKRCRYEERDAAARRGTEVHGYAHALAAGEDVTPPDELLGHVDAYLAFADVWQPSEILTEVTVGNRRYRYMGTLDAVAKLADGQTWLLDFKTNRSGVYIESALQLAAYRHAEWYLGINGDELPMPEVDQCGVLWLRADGFDLYPIDASEQTFRKFLHAQQVARFITAPKEAVIGESLNAPEVVA